MTSLHADAPRRVPPAPDLDSLREAALRHLSRYAATEAGLIRVLDRRIERWVLASGAEAEAGAAARALAREVARGLARSGAVDDAAFAEARARRLVRSGRSRQAVAAHLAAKGVDKATAEAALPDAEAEVAAAVAFLRRRRMGPFRAEPDTEDAVRQRELGALARAGFARDVAERALGFEPEAAEAILRRVRAG